MTLDLNFKKNLTDGIRDMNIKLKCLCDKFHDFNSKNSITREIYKKLDLIETKINNLKIENNTFRDNLLVKLDKLIELNTKNDILETEFNKLVTENDEMNVKQDEIKEIKLDDVNNKKN